MTVEQLAHEADIHSGEDLGRTVFAQVREALRQGQDREEIIAILTDFYTQLGDQGREDDQDAIADVLDSLTGFSSPTAAL